MRRLFRRFLFFGRVWECGGSVEFRSQSNDCLIIVINFFEVMAFIGTSYTGITQYLGKMLSSSFPFEPTAYVNQVEIITARRFLASPRHENP